MKFNFVTHTPHLFKRNCYFIFFIIIYRITLYNFSAFLIIKIDNYLQEKSNKKM